MQNLYKWAMWKRLSGHSECSCQPKPLDWMFGIVLLLLFAQKTSEHSDILTSGECLQWTFEWDQLVKQRGCLEISELSNQECTGRSHGHIHKYRTGRSDRKCNNNDLHMFFAVFCFNCYLVQSSVWRTKFSTVCLKDKREFSWWFQYPLPAPREIFIAKTNKSVFEVHFVAGETDCFINVIDIKRKWICVLTLRC